MMVLIHLFVILAVLWHVSHPPREPTVTSNHHVIVLQAIDTNSGVLLVLFLCPVLLAPVQQYVRVSPGLWLSLIAIRIVPTMYLVFT